MREGSDPGTPPQDTGPPDQVERDPAALSSAEDLDEDRLGVDPLERGMDPPERWSAADRYGTTPFEQSHGQDLEHRLREEEPDTALEELSEPSTAAPDTEWAEPMDSSSADVDRSGSSESESYAVRRGQSADEAGGSVADTIRRPSGER